MIIIYLFACIMIIKFLLSAAFDPRHPCISWDEAEKLTKNFDDLN